MFGKNLENLEYPGNYSCLRKPGKPGKLREFLNICLWSFKSAHFQFLLFVILLAITIIQMCIEYKLLSQWVAQGSQFTLIFNFLWSVYVFFVYSVFISIIGGTFIIALSWEFNLWQVCDVSERNNRKGAKW